MSVMAKRELHGVPVRITRPEIVRGADGSKTRAGKSENATELFASVKVRFMSLTTERREHVFGATSRATETVRVPIMWELEEGDQIEVLAGSQADQRFRVEKIIAYRGRPRISHQECALIELPEGAR